jgi:hypothetical protein
MMNLNFRVFRRNNKNLILLWSQSQLSDPQREGISAFAVDDGTDADGRPLKYSKFVPDNPEKFAPDVGGIVVSHAVNGLNPSEPCTVRVVLGDGEDSLEMVKEVLPANSVGDIPPRPAEPHRKVYLYAKDNATDTWVPWPADGVLPGNVQIMIKD